MSDTITQIVSFITEEKVSFEKLANAARTGSNGLRDQVFGGGVEEPKAKHWIIGERFS